MGLGSEKAGKKQFADVGINTEIIWSLGKKNFWQKKVVYIMAKHPGSC